MQVLLDGAEVAPPVEQHLATDLLLWSINQQVAHRTLSSVLVHAGVVSLDGRAVLMPGRSGAGKSTLTAALVRAGCDYLTDEAAVIDLTTGSVRSYHRPIGLKPGSWALLPAARPPDARPELGFGSNGWYVDPRQLRAGSLAPDARPALVIFPERQAGASGVLTELRPVETALGLATNALNLGLVGARGMSRLAELSKEARGYRLAYDALGAGVEAVMAALELSSSP